MALMTKLKCPCIISWIKTRLPIAAPPFHLENTVAPVRINVQTVKPNDNSESVKAMESTSTHSIFSVENEYFSQGHRLSMHSDNNHIDGEKCESHALTALPMMSVTTEWMKSIDGIISASSVSCLKHEGLQAPGTSLKLSSLTQKTNSSNINQITTAQNVLIGKQTSLLPDLIVRGDEPNEDGSEDKLSDISKPSNFSHTHFDIMYYLGISAYRTRPRPCDKTDLDDKKSLLYFAESGAHLLFFWVIAVMSVSKSFCDAKYQLMWFLFKGGLNLFVKFAFNLRCMITSVYGVSLLCLKGNAMKKMVDNITIYEQSWTGRSKKSVFSVVLVSITAVSAALKSLLVMNVDEYSGENLILYGSTQTSEDIYIWVPYDLNITSQQLDYDFGSSVNSVTIIFAILNFMRGYVQNIQLGMMCVDLFGHVTLTIFCWMMRFVGFVSKVMENVADENSVAGVNLQRKRELVWNMYREIRGVFGSVNDVFGPLLVLFHATNVLRFAFFMEHCIYPEEVHLFSYIDLLYNIVKSEIIYMMAANIAEQNELIRKWLRNWALYSGTIKVHNREMGINVVLDELDREPLGLGKGNFIIDQRFHFGLLGLVSSLFVMLANKTGLKV